MDDSDRPIISSGFRPSDVRYTRRQLLTRGALASTSLLLAPGLLAACGVTSPSGASSGSPVSSIGPTPGTSAKAGSAAVVIGTTNTFGTFDPFNFLRLNNPILRTVYSYLIDYTSDLTAIPNMAQSWEIAGDRSSVTVHLRQATFHDGSAVTADDLVAAVNRTQDPNAALNLLGPGKLMSGATKVGDGLVKISFVRPLPDSAVLDLLFQIPIVKASGNNPNALKTTPAGCGPFALKSYDPGNKLVLARNPSYWDTGKPYVDEVDWRFFGDANSLVAALKSGDVNAALYVPPALTPELADAYTLAVTAPHGLPGLLYLNPQIPPFDNKLVRQAIARAYDRDRVIKDVLRGLAEPTYGPFNPPSPAFDKSYLQKLGFDLTAAKQLLDQSGVTSLTADVYVPGSDPIRQQQAQILAANLSTIGFTLRINLLEIATFSSQFRAGKSAAVFSGTADSLNTPANITSDGAFATTNNFLWGPSVPAAWTQAIQTAETALTTDDQKAAYAQMNAVLADEAWVIGTYVWPDLTYLDKNITGYSQNPNGVPILTDMKLG